jgi:hypothetical protein
VLTRWSISFFTHGRGARRIESWEPRAGGTERGRHAA